MSDITECTKPPIGLMPISVFRENKRKERMAAILDAMRRYAEAKENIPVYWVNELDELIWQE